MQRQLTFGGVSPRGTLLRGQSIIEYVLIIAIIVLAIVFAGPGVAGAIRNQFNLVGNTVNNGTTGGVEGGASGGGSAGADSATVQAAVAKDAKDRTLSAQKPVDENIDAKGEASPAYAKAKTAMDAGIKFSMELTDGRTLRYRIIGINHDDLVDGSGKAGLTFLTTSNSFASRVNATDTNAGGWEKSELRKEMNSGEIWRLMPVDFQSKVKAVKKLTNNFFVCLAIFFFFVTATTERLFLLSYSEIVETPYSDWSDYSWIGQEGTQYEAFKGKVTNNYSGNDCLKIGDYWWERSANPNYSNYFLCIESTEDGAFDFCKCLGGLPQSIFVLTGPNWSRPVV